MRSTTEIAASLSRAKVILHALNSFAKTGASRLNYLEIGTAFSEREGLSTLLAAVFLMEKKLLGSVHSIDNNVSHIEASRSIIATESPALLERVFHYEGTSLEVLRSAIANSGSVDVAFIDGGADARVNLWEFLTIIPALSDDGIIIVDDVTYLAKTQYKARRDFGKAQLIYPFLLIAETLNTFIGAATPSTDPASQISAINTVTEHDASPDLLKGFLRAPECLEFLDTVRDFHFAKVGSLLIVAREKVFTNSLGFSLDENLNAVGLDRMNKHII